MTEQVNKPIRVLIVEDHELVLQGFKALLKNEESIDIVGTASNGQEALSFIAQNPKVIDVAIVDVKMPVMDGIEATKQITALYPTIKVLALSMHEEETYIKGMYGAGAKGYVLKGTNMEDLRQAIFNVHQDRTHFSAKIKNSIFEARMNDLPLEGSKQKNKLAQELTNRELEILTYIASGWNTNEIGTKLFIAASTVDTHRRNIISKLGKKNSTELAAYAVKEGLIELTDEEPPVASNDQAGGRGKKESSKKQPV